MRLVCVEEGEWKPVLIVYDKTVPWRDEVLVMNNVGQCWVDKNDLATMKDWERMVR